MILMLLTSFIKKWIVFVMKIQIWEFTLFKIQMDIG